MSSSSPPPPEPPQGRNVTTRHPKRLRRAARQVMVASPSSDDDDSQSGMLDNDPELDPARTSPAPHDPAPPKKKRTRTLTTPHQSAVLHALLAKSPFPTTAMREEVGRQIGLSARKVQIWFQNQRQKARRPQSESGPLTRPPQFGPFPISSELSPTSARSAASLDCPPPLSGPGMPGSSSQHPRRHSSCEERDPPRPSPKIPHGPSHSFPSFDPSVRDSRATPRSLAQPARPHVASPAPHFSRVLPPINLSPLEPRSTAEPCPSATPSAFPPPSSRNFVNTVARRDPSAPDLPSTTLGFPPPFALQPQPQWDPHAFTPFTRPEFASWSHPSRAPRHSFSPLGAHDLPSPRARHLIPSGEPRRSGQLDPPLPHHIISSSRGERHPSSASSPRASASGRAHATDD